MKKYIITVLLISISSFLVSSCAGFLDEENYSKATVDYYKTPSGLDAAVIACYNSMRSWSNSENGYAFEDLGTDLFQEGADGGHRSAWDQYTNDLNSGNGLTSSLWNNCYQSISYINTTLGMFDESTLSDEIKRVRRSELLFLRSFYYFELVIAYGDCVLITEPVSGPKTDFVREPQKNIWDFAFNDAQEAFDNLTWTDNKSDFGRVTKAAAGHLLAKWYLYRSSVPSSEEDRGQKSDDFDNAIKYATEVIDNSGHTLEQDYAALWDINNRKSNEIIFATQYDRAEAEQFGEGNWLHLFYIPDFTLTQSVVRDLTTGRPWRRLRITQAAADMFDADNDSRLYKSFKWVYPRNNKNNADKWVDVFSPKDASKLIWSPDPSIKDQFKQEMDETALVYSLIKLPYDVNDDEYAIARAQKPFMWLPNNSWTPNFFPCLIKYLDPGRSDMNLMPGARDHIRMRLAETYLIRGEAYARKGDFANAAKDVNVVRQRAAWKEGEDMANFSFMKDGSFPVVGTIHTDTQNAMTVTAGDIEGYKGGYLYFFLDERGREMLGEVNRRSDLRRCGTQVMLDRIKVWANHPYAKENLLPKHRYNPIPQGHIDATYPPDPNPQNEGY